jgi:DNA-binding transcriptional LysR family regulator
MRYFVAVVEHGQVSSAARGLHLAQPALTQSIHQLERELGVRLLDRHARGISTTPAGQAFFDKARTALAAADAASAAARDWARSEAKQLTIGFLPSGLFAAAGLMEEFRRRHPDVRLTISQLTFADRLRQLNSHRIDAEILAPIPGADHLTCERIYVAPRVAVMSAQHRLAGRESLRFDDVARERMPGGHPDVPEDFLDYNWLTAARGSRPPVTDETPLTPEECIPLLARGDVIVVSPAFVAPPLTMHGLIAIPVTDVPPFVFGIACRADDRRPTVQALIELARERTAAAGPMPPDPYAVTSA